MAVRYLESYPEDFDSDQLTLDGELRKQAGIRTVLLCHSEYRDRVVEWVLSLPLGSLIDAERIRESCGEPPHENAMGGVVSYLAKKNYIRKHSYRTATRPQAHAREIRVYEVV